jgi:hypothetical protein
VLVEWVATSPTYDETTIFNTVGTWSWTAPPQLTAGDKVDVILCSGGRGGQKGSSGDGRGGSGGALVYTTITIGTEIPVGGTLTGIIGAGGAANDGNGGNTTCTTIGLTALGATTRVASGLQGGTPGYVSVNKRTYAGGLGGDGAATIFGRAGGVPGGGGNGGNGMTIGDGGVGGSGRVWVRGYQI